MELFFTPKEIIRRDMVVVAQRQQMADWQLVRAALVAYKAREDYAGEIRRRNMMSRFETKIIQIPNDPDLINQTNNTYSHFYWNVQSVQITNARDSHIERSFMDAQAGVEKVVTTTINYATITYQRDIDIPHYADFVRLENEYAQLQGEINSLIASEEVAFLPSLGALGKLLLLVFLWPVFIVLLIVYIIKKVTVIKNRPEANRKIEQYELQQEQVLEKCRAIA